LGKPDSTAQSSGKEGRLSGLFKMANAVFFFFKKKMSLLFQKGFCVFTIVKMSIFLIRYIFNRVVCI
jgi:hypothetical protein